MARVASGTATVRQASVILAVQRVLKGSTSAKLAAAEMVTQYEYRTSRDLTGLDGIFFLAAAENASGPMQILPGLAGGVPMEMTIPVALSELPPAWAPPEG